MTKVVLTEEQEEAVKGITKWFKEGEKQECKLVGYAGTGKTFLTQHIIKSLKLKRREVVFVAFTGRASLELKKRVKDYECKTAHSLMYDTEIDKDDNPVFYKKHKRELRQYKLIVLDEASTLSKQMNDDILSYGIPVLFTGDAGQLPSFGEKFDALENPDFVLNEIHRQAKGNKIIELSMMARKGIPIKPGVYGKNVVVMRKSDVSQETMDRLYINSDQIICGFNATRKKVNKRARELLGFKNEMPEVGDKIICLRNNWSRVSGGYPLVNGLGGYVTKVSEDIKKGKQKDGSYVYRDAIRISFKTDFDEDVEFKDLVVLKSDFTGVKEKLEIYEKSVYDSFDFGYSMTCHKSQGSQFENVLVLNEIVDPETRYSWPYVAITRAEINLIYLI